MKQKKNKIKTTQLCNWDNKRETWKNICMLWKGDARFAFSYDACAISRTKGYKMGTGIRSSSSSRSSSI